MVDMSLIEGNVKLPETQTVLKWTADPREVEVNTNKGGVFLPNVKLGDFIVKGDEVGIIYSPRSFEVLERLVAPQSGYVFSVRENPVVNIGTRVMTIPEVIEEIKNELK